MTICGIDPGLSGAIAIFEPFEVYDMPTHLLTRGKKSKREIDVAGLSAILGGRGLSHAFIEQVGAMPGQGVSGVFAFGKAYGIVIGVLTALGVAITFVPPQRWKKVLGVPKAKDGARARASQLMPQAAGNWPLVRHDGRAEASLIALWGARHLQSGFE
jgi:crossover junction endodeoxyribonuclease RuvC